MIWFIGLAKTALSSLNSGVTSTLVTNLNTRLMSFYNRWTFDLIFSTNFCAPSCVVCPATRQHQKSDVSEILIFSLRPKLWQLRIRTRKKINLRRCLLRFSNRRWQWLDSAAVLPFQLFSASAVLPSLATIVLLLFLIRGNKIGFAKTPISWINASAVIVGTNFKNTQKFSLNNEQKCFSPLQQHFCSSA